MIVAIIQARMDSQRLPGKVLKEIQGKTVVEYSLERLQLSELVDRVVLATSVNASDDSLCEHVSNKGFEVFRGEEDDVLDRFYQCALHYEADIVVRITADCPLVDPMIVDEFIQYYQAHADLDLLYTGASYPEGLDVVIIPFKSLQIAHTEAKLYSEREHVTPFIWKNADRFKVQVKEYESDCSAIRITVDEQVDLDVVQNVMAVLIQENGIGFSLKDIIALYEKRPELFMQNKDIIRNEGYLKSLKEDHIVEERT